MNKADTAIDKKLGATSMKKLNKKNRKSVETTENVKNAPASSALNGETIAAYDELVRRLIGSSGIANIGNSDASQSCEAKQATSANIQNDNMGLQTSSLPHVANNNNHKIHDKNNQYKQSKQISKTSGSNNGIAATIINDDGSVTVQCNGSYPSLATKFVRDPQDQPSTSSPGQSERCSFPLRNNVPIKSNPAVEMAKSKSHTNLVMDGTASPSSSPSSSSSCFSNIAASSSPTLFDPNSQTPKTVASIKANGVEISIKEYVNELQMPDLIRVIQKDLSEPYSIYTYRYFIHNWPKLCFLAMDADKCIGAIVCKLDVHRQTIRRGYIAMLAVDKDYRKLKVGTTLVHKAIEVSITLRIKYTFAR